MIEKIYLKTLLFLINILDYGNKKRIINYFKNKFFKEKVVIFDIGSHKGDTVDLFIKNLNVRKIYAFEPNTKLFEKSKKKYFKKENVIINNFALGENNIILKLNISKDGYSSSLNEINESSSYFKKKNKIINFFSSSQTFFNDQQIVNVFKISKIINDLSLNQIDIIKIDTEGYEFNILKGIETSHFKFIKYIYFEHHYDQMLKKKYNFSDINNLLEKNSFKLDYKTKMKFRKSFEYIYVNKNI